MPTVLPLVAAAHATTAEPTHAEFELHTSSCAPPQESEEDREQDDDSSAGEYRRSMYKGRPRDGTDVGCDDEEEYYPSDDDDELPDPDRWMGQRDIANEKQDPLLKQALLASGDGRGEDTASLLG
jgi:hypothetical protein